jgi:hypothetical protein
VYLLVVQGIRTEVQYFVTDLPNTIQCFYKDAAIDIQVEPNPSAWILQKPDVLAKSEIASTRR